MNAKRTEDDGQLQITNDCLGADDNVYKVKVKVVISIREPTRFLSSTPYRHSPLNIAHLPVMDQ